MNNYRNSYILEKNTFVDDFDNYSNTATIEKPFVNEISEEEREFNSNIRSNFDKIFNYNSNTVTAQPDYKVVADATPSATTMQFANTSSNDIYQDYREDVEVSAAVKMRGGVKALIMLFTAIVIALSVLIVFNTALLKNMNGLIEQKTAQVELLQQEKQLKQVELDKVSSDEVVKETAKEYGMVEAE